MCLCSLVILVNKSKEFTYEITNLYVQGLRSLFCISGFKKS